MNYLFGYGSLINNRSRAKTGVTGTAFPVRIAGYARAWNMPSGPGTYLGVRSAKTGGCNGLLCAVSDQELLRFDVRERGYRRESVSRSALEMLVPETLDSFPIWTYVIDTPRKPTIMAPILQSYVDVVLDGCLVLGEDFAREFLRTTSGWEHPWQNDRSEPRYLRADANLPSLDRIDELLAEAGLLRHRQ